MSAVPNAVEVTRRLADALEKAGIPYAVAGGVAFGLHAPPRATYDVDLCVFVDASRLDEVFDALEAAGADVIRDEARSSARRRQDFVARFQGMRIDVFLPSVPLHESACERVCEGVLLDRPIRALSAEDVALFKLILLRPRDVLDVERLVAYKGPSFDHAYVRRWLVEMAGPDDDVIKRWDEIVETFGTGPPASR